MNTPITHQVTVLDANGRPYDPDLSPYLPAGVVPAPEQGYFLLPRSATPLTGVDAHYHREDKVWRYDNTYYNNQNLALEHRQYPACIAWCRPVHAAVSLHERMKEYAETGRKLVKIEPQSVTEKSVQQTLAEVLKRIESLEDRLGSPTYPPNAAAKPEDTKVKQGDWAVCLANSGCKSFVKDGIYKIKDLSGNCLNLEKDEKGSSTNSWHKSYFRKATSAEISAHLAAESEKERAKSKKVTVAGVAGVQYTSIYHPGYVQFGCAKISNGLIRDLDVVLANPAIYVSGNRFAESVTIGAATFTKEDIARLAANLIDS